MHECIILYNKCCMIMMHECIIPYSICRGMLTDLYPHGSNTSTYEVHFLDTARSTHNVVATKKGQW